MNACIVKNSIISSLLLFSGMVLLSDNATAQSRYNGRAASTASRADAYRQSRASGSMPRSGSGLTTSSEPADKKTRSSSRPERIGGPYRSPLKPRSVPEAPALPHTAKAVVPQSYKSEYDSNSAAKR